MRKSLDRVQADCPLSERLRSLRARAKAGEAGAVLAELRIALRQRQATPEELEAAGRFLRRLVSEGHVTEQRWHVRWAGQCTTAWLANVTAAVAWREGFLLETSEAAFDNVFQDVANAQSESEPTRPEFRVFVPWLHPPENVLTSAVLEDRVQTEVAFWEQVWGQSQAAGARILQVGFDLMHIGPAGYHQSIREGPALLVQRLNEALRQRLPRNAFFIDLSLVAAGPGRWGFYDPRRFMWTRQPFSELGTVVLAEHLVAGLRALLTGPKKVLVLDLDNTLWGGIVGEVGPHHLALRETPEGEAYLLFQRHVKGLAWRGVALAVASKNNPADAREPFLVNPDMVLRLEDFACFEANWEPKARALQRIADTLNLGLDSLVFFDDSPAEREHIRQVLPQVSVVEVPTDPAEYVRALETGLWFETVAVTTEDRLRTQQYQQEQQRRTLQEDAVSVEDYLRSLDMTAQVADLVEADLPRVVQLLAKTNQFNLTTRRHSEEDVRRLLSSKNFIGLTVRLADRFGDYGLIAVVLAVADSQVEPGTLVIDTWLMSCRVIGRTVEQFVGERLRAAAQRQGYRRIVGRYVPTAKNKLVADLYPRLGFQSLPDDDKAGQRFVLEVDSPPIGVTFVR